MPHIAERELELPDAVIGKLISLAAESKNVISLGPGEPDFPLPKPLVQHTKKIADKVNHYSPPSGLFVLREAIAKKVKKDNGIDADPDNVIVTAGSQEALLISLACTLDVSEQIIIPNPSFLAYLPLADLFSTSPVFVQLKEEENFEINPDEVKKLVDSKKTKAIIINTPSNPTGTVIKKKTLEELADIAVDNDLYIFSDEAYEKIIYDEKHVSIASLNGMENNVVTFQTFSKSYAMAGYRVGYCVAPPSLAEYIVKTHVYTSICAPTISQHLALKALSMKKIYIDRMVKEYKRRRGVIVKRLNEIGLHTIMPQGAFYTFSRIPSLDSRKFAFDLLQKAKVAVVPGAEFGRFGEGYIRCSYATKYPFIEMAMERMENFVKEYGKH
jgi:aminotransferase